MGRFSTAHSFDDFPRKLPRALSSYQKAAGDSELRLSLFDSAVNKVVIEIMARNLVTTAPPDNTLNESGEAGSMYHPDLSTVPGALAAKALIVIFERERYDNLPSYGKSIMVERIAKRAMEIAVSEQGQNTA